MEVELQRALLTAQPREDLVLLALCAFGLDGRHRILPDDRAAWEPWPAALPADLADEVRLVWDESEQRSAVGGPSERVAVAPAAALQFDKTPLVVTPSEALALLGRPLRVLLENGRNDRAFVLAFADGASHQALLKAEREGWIVFETAGGIGELVQRIGVAPDSEPREVLAAIALKELHPDARGFLDMKEGRLRKNKPPKPDTVRTVHIVWNPLDAFQKAALFDGFGAGFSADFYADRRGLKDETGEITALLATILKRL